MPCKIKAAQMKTAALGFCPLGHKCCIFCLRKHSCCWGFSVVNSNEAILSLSSAVICEWLESFFTKQISNLELVLQSRNYDEKSPGYNRRRVFINPLMHNNPWLHVWNNFRVPNIGIMANWKEYCFILDYLKII